MEYTEPAILNAALSKKREEKNTKTRGRKKQAQISKNQGNEYFVAGRYVEAITKYHEAARLYGTRPVLMCSLAAAYLKLEQFETAEWASNCALFYSPGMLRARFLRSMARKGQGLFKGAEIDLTIIVKRRPDFEIEAELAEVRLERRRHGDGHRWNQDDNDDDDGDDDALPPFTNEEWEPAIGRDSECARHEGNGVPCKLYNQGRCSDGNLCVYSHAEDEESVRDDLDRNVCIEFLLGGCHYGFDCAYAHTKDALPDGWWSSPEQIEEANQVRSAITSPLANEPLFKTLRYVSEYGRFVEERRYMQSSELREGGDYDYLLKSRIRWKLDNWVGLWNNSTPQHPGRTILILCLSDYLGLFSSVHRHLLKALSYKVKLVYGHTARDALTHLQAPELAGVIVADEGIIKPLGTSVLPSLVAYVQRGGLTVVTGLFQNCISPDDFTLFFKRNFGLPWKWGDYFRTTVYKNATNHLVKGNPSLAESYSVKAVYMQGVAPESALYKADESTNELNIAFPPTGFTAAASERVGNGMVSYVGDVNSESAEVILATLGLLDEPLPPAPDMTGLEPSGVVEPQAVSIPASQNSERRTPGNESFIMQLCLIDNGDLAWSYQSSVMAIETRIRVRKATTEAQALDLLKNPHIAGVFVTDCGLTHRNYEALVERLVSYVDEGGCIVFGGSFSRIIQSSKLGPFFAKFHLDWVAGYATSELVSLSPDWEGLARNPFLPEEFKLRALFLTGVSSGDGLYRPKYTTMASSQIPIALSRNSKRGSIGYVGDVNATSLTLPSILTMFQLIEYARSVPRPLPRGFVVALSESYNWEEYEGMFLFRRLKAEGIEIVTLSGISESRLGDLFLSPDLQGVILLDDLITLPEHEWLAHHVVRHIWQGGTAILGADLGSMSPEGGFRAFLERYFYLPWETSGTIEVSMCATVNQGSDLFKHLPPCIERPSDTLAYSGQGAFLYNVGPDAVVYSSQPGPDGSMYVPVAYSPVGNGRIAYFGAIGIGEVEVGLILEILKLRWSSTT